MRRAWSCNSFVESPFHDLSRRQVLQIAAKTRTMTLRATLHLRTSSIIITASRPCIELVDQKIARPQHGTNSAKPNHAVDLADSCMLSIPSFGALHSVALLKLGRSLQVITNSPPQTCQSSTVANGQMRLTPRRCKGRGSTYWHTPHMTTNLGLMKPLPNRVGRA